jgi:hypothetical protein
MRQLAFCMTGYEATNTALWVYTIKSYRRRLIYSREGMTFLCQNNDSACV